MPAGSDFLDRMIDRVFSSMTRGPALNCKPQNSRQRVDLARLSELEGGTAPLLPRLFADRKVDLSVMAEPAAKAGETPDPEWERYQAQRLVFQKLRVIAEDALLWERETGASSLFVGLPTLSLARATRRGPQSRVLAPIALVPITLSVRPGLRPTVRIQLAAEGADLVVPNYALLAFIEQATGKQLPEVDPDDTGANPWAELQGLIAAVCGALDLPPVVGDAEFGANTLLQAVPRLENDRFTGIFPSAVLGLFPTSGQATLRDLEAIAETPPISGPVAAFLDVQHALAAAPLAARPHRLVTEADPCQAAAVLRAGSASGIVVHGPPGTGKSQTITNVVGDHLARGERVLVVCEKRGALDVVAHRLHAAGLGGLVAVVHDATRDRTELYRDVREQLDALSERVANTEAPETLARLDAELGALHGELSKTDALLSQGSADSFHQRVGEWLGISVAPELAAVVGAISGVSLAQFDTNALAVREVLDRGAQANWGSNAWRDALRPGLAEFLAAPVGSWRDPIAALTTLAPAVDAGVHPGDVPFPAAYGPRAVGTALEQLADALERAVSLLGEQTTERLLSAPALGATATILGEHAAQLGAPLDPELVERAANAALAEAQVAAGLTNLENWLSTANDWYGALFFWKTSAAQLVTKRLALPLTAGNAERVRDYLRGKRARMEILAAVRVLGLGSETEQSDDELRGVVNGMEAVSRARALRGRPELTSTLRGLWPEGSNRAGEPVLSGSGGTPSAPGALPAIIAALRRAAARAAPLEAFETSLSQCTLLNAAAAERLRATARAGNSVGDSLAALNRDFGTVESLLRLTGRLSELPDPLASTVRRVLPAKATPEAGLSALRKAALSAELAGRLAANPALAAIDATRVTTCFARLADLLATKQGAVREAIVQSWTARQRERLLATTGTRLNGTAAALKRRLGLRGEKALRLRQCLAAGAAIEGGDPLFDMKPVWMASPETVATIFARDPMFDIVIFDEASQCRLEEALGVLTRGKRVLIAGDPQQLPPTRFFESAMVETAEIETNSDQSLFESQQAAVEDLLGAALNLEIEEAFLDVHYRSRDAALIEFSNAHFYAGRLQAIPAHPLRKSAAPPISLTEVLGIYEDRTNRAEAAAVVDRVEELLMADPPPSIGIACFNLDQRDAILELLDEAALANPGFAEKLAAARQRQGSGSFEGLFVKNLESVQGDERDHMIISTTYGPDPKGKFYRRFGPLGLPGGGRRLNVLVTRAREHIHVITSIPRDQWATESPLPDGAKPNGGYLLFAYLRYAAKLADEYSAGIPVSAKQRFATRTPSAAVAGVARELRGHGSVTEYWGNDGFCVDVALIAGDNSAAKGILVDGARFDKVEDRVAWDLFRMGVLRNQGWDLIRICTPQVFRNIESIHLAVDA